MKPKTLTDVMNNLYSESRFWNIRGWNESSGRAVQLSLDFDNKEINREQEISTMDIAQIAWRAGMIPSRNDDELTGYIDEALENPGNRTVAISLDTNLVIARFYPNYMRMHHPQPYDYVPHFLVVPAGVDHELHYQMSNTFRKGDPFLAAMEDEYKRDSESYRLLTGEYTEPDIHSNREPLLRVASKKGRTGIKGLREMRRLQEEHRVIISMPAHLYYSERIQSEGKFVDAIFDSLIRYETQFLQKNTNSRIIFLTADKHQYNSATNDGMECRYVKQPTSGSAWNDIEKSRFTTSYIGKFLEEMCVYSPYIEVKAGDMKVYLASAWEAMGHEESRLGRLKCIIDRNRLTLDIG